MYELLITTERRLGAIITKFVDHCCTQYCWMELQKVEVNQNVSQISHDWWKTNKYGNDICWKWNCKNIRYD